MFERHFRPIVTADDPYGEKLKLARAIDGVGGL